MTPLQAFVETHPRLFVLTGAGCSTASGIPDYRDRDGQWKRTPPVTFAAFMQEPHTRRRYWARSLLGWRRFGHALPNATHHALVELERQGRIELLVTQNVDGLHQRAGNGNVVDLHGRLDTVRCMSCDWRGTRHDFQRALVERNPEWTRLDANDAPDGDADLEAHDFGRFDVPPCPHCNAIVKPDVVFFGENVPSERVVAAMDACRRADAMLVVGSSLMVYSGYRFAHAAAQAGRPVAAVTLGRTRADALLALKVDAPCEEALGFLLAPASPDASGVATAAT
ncbi:NAD-dependent protein deacetylase [Rhodanobacter sp. 7MK24]|uniref:NAD-dependent protein deacetylase n=1 Tax=Rhodanobacter sp. 7MK24 TaxID=2775922 RepID=UPI00178144A9|nr:NAD-dependent protein deacetylase [Rhodanobacter sp. 7MK24]MBD8879577.1 NAD-dependent protein deacetylase [Rhodanobacter sp. 7MK24]